MHPLKSCVWGFSHGSVVKNLPANAGDAGSTPGSGNPLGGKWLPTPGILAWEIPWTEESGGLQPMGLQRVRKDWAAKQQQLKPCVQGEASSLLLLPESGPPKSGWWRRLRGRGPEGPHILHCSAYLPFGTESSSHHPCLRPSPTPGLGSNWWVLCKCPWREALDPGCCLSGPPKLG